MMRSLWTAASGMVSQQFNMDTIANNLSNVNTTGYKKQRAEFEDLIYQTQLMAGTPATEITEIPTGIQVGHGSRVSATQKMFSQGSMQATENKFDLALDGDGFFKVQLYDGSSAYTRDGSWKVDSNRQMVNSDGYLMDPPITFPDNFINESVAISPTGRVTCKVVGDDDITEVGNIEMYRFVNPAGLSSAGGNLYKTTPASGEEIAGRPGMDGMGATHQGFLEMSNVKIVEEMVSMIVAQRAYETNSKSIQTSDNMLGTAIGLKKVRPTMKYSITLILMIIAIPAFADVRIFLYPRCEFDGQNLKLEDIAWIEGDSSQSDSVKKIKINQSFWRDGFIDRQELDKILKDEKVELYSVVGNSTKVVKTVGDKAEKEKIEKKAAHAVKKGDRVMVSIHSGKIFLEMAGTVSGEAFPGDEVSVDLGKKKTIKGILKEDRKVEVKI